MKNENLNPSTKWENKFYIGDNNNEKIYLSAPSWDCGWYWGFGYLGNKNCHYHLDGLGAKNLYDNIREHFGKSLRIIEKDLWVFCELVKSCYQLIEIAELYKRGGAHYTTNPCQDLLQDFEQYTKINTVLLPALFDKIGELLDSQEEKFKKKQQIDKEIKELEKKIKELEKNKKTLLEEADLIQSHIFNISK